MRIDSSIKYVVVSSTYFVIGRIKYLLSLNHICCVIIAVEVTLEDITIRVVIYVAIHQAVVGE